MKNSMKKIIRLVNQTLLYQYQNHNVNANADGEPNENINGVKAAYQYLKTSIDYIVSRLYELQINIPLENNNDIKKEMIEEYKFLLKFYKYTPFDKKSDLISNDLSASYGTLDTSQGIGITSSIKIADPVLLNLNDFVLFDKTHFSGREMNKPFNMRFDSTGTKHMPVEKKLSIDDLYSYNNQVELRYLGIVNRPDFDKGSVDYFKFLTEEERKALLTINFKASKALTGHAQTSRHNINNSPKAIFISFNTIATSEGIDFFKSSKQRDKIINNVINSNGYYIYANDYTSEFETNIEGLKLPKDYKGSLTFFAIDEAIKLLNSEDIVLDGSLIPVKNNMDFLIENVKERINRDKEGKDKQLFDRINCLLTNNPYKENSTIEQHNSLLRMGLEHILSLINKPKNKPPKKDSESSDDPEGSEPSKDSKIKNSKGSKNKNSKDSKKPSGDSEAEVVSEFEKIVFFNNFKKYIPNKKMSHDDIKKIEDVDFKEYHKSITEKRNKLLNDICTAKK